MMEVWNLHQWSVKCSSRERILQWKRNTRPCLWRRSESSPVTDISVPGYQSWETVPSAKWQVILLQKAYTNGTTNMWAGQRSRYSDWLRAGRSGDRIPVGAWFSAPVQTGPGAHPASCVMGTGSFPGVKSCRGVTLTPHPLIVPWSRKSRAIPLLPLWAVRPV